MLRHLNSKKGIMIALVAIFVATSFAISPRSVQAADFVPELDIPVLFSGPQEINNNLFGRYIRAIYVYFIWVVGIVATGMIIYAGVKWVAAAGDQGRIRDARDMINNAIIGVIIGLTSVVLLNLLSPGFTTLSIPDPRTVRPSTFTPADPLYYKDANGACRPSSEIPCGLTCTQAATGQVVRGDCRYCESAASIPNSDQLCGTLAKGPEVLAKDGNCVFLVCANATDACTVQENALKMTMGQYSCKTDTSLDLSDGGYTATTVQYSRSYACGELWYEQASNGIIGIGAHPERLFAGTKCPATPASDTYKVCLFDLTQTVVPTTLRSAIPASQEKTKIGAWPLARCY